MNWLLNASFLVTAIMVGVAANSLDWASASFCFLQSLRCIAITKDD